VVLVGWLFASDNNDYLLNEEKSGVKFNFI